MKIAVIGGGPAGLVASIYAKNNKNEVVLFERNSKCGKKLLLTGNGKGNYWNSDQDSVHYHSRDVALLKEIIAKDHLQETSLFLERLGLIPFVKNGYWYPYSLTATALREALITEVKRKNISVVPDFFVSEIVKEGSTFLLNPTKERLAFDAVVLATGSKAYPKTGSDGTGYLLAQSLGHSLVPVFPSLVALEGGGSYTKKWAGIRTEALVTSYENGEIQKEERGTLQLTDYGISGICVFNLSSPVARGLAEGKKEEVIINFVPWLTEDLLPFLNTRSQKMSPCTLSFFLEGFLHYRLVLVLLEHCALSPATSWNALSKKQKELLCQALTAFRFTVSSTRSFEQSQVCSGGIPLAEVNPKTMESIIVPNLFLVGELLDVNGDCGGYNLSFAFLSGMLAGKELGK